MTPLRHSLQFLSASLFALSLSISSSLPAYAEANQALQQQLQTISAGTWRSDNNKARDQYRHPVETLMFFGISPQSRVIEIFPGGGAWYTEILAPLLKDQGQLTLINPSADPEDAGQQEKLAADPVRYGRVKVREISPQSTSFGAPASADMVLTFRNVHNFVMNKNEAEFFNEAFKVLKPGGVLGVVDHRAAPGKTIDEVRESGYLPEEFVIAAAEKAGFSLDGRSAINNNPKDIKNYPKGLWSLPPTLAEGDVNRSQYLEIGETDRFTLRFVKPQS